MHDFLSDLRYGLRMLAKAPVGTAVAVVSLAFAIGANTVTFSVASGFLWESFRWHDPERVMLLLERHRNESDDREVRPGVFLHWREATASGPGATFQALEAFTVRPVNLGGLEEPQRVSVVEATPGLFSLIGRQPALGRGFRSGEAAAPVVVLSHEFFVRALGGDESVLDSSLQLDGAPHTVMGVLPQDFDFVPANVDLYRPVDLEPRRHDFEQHAFLVLGRLADGVEPDEARAELRAVTRRLSESRSETGRGWGARAMTLEEFFPGPTDTRLMVVLMTVAAFILVVACANLVSLFLARAESRQTETAVRSALGAGRRRILIQHLTESVLVALAGGVVGIAVSVWAVRGLAAGMPAELPRVFFPAVDPLVLVYGFLVSLVAGLLLGAVPALQASRIAPASVLGESSRGGTGSRRARRLRAGFIVVETAAAVAMLTGAGVLVETFDALVQEAGNIRVDGVLTLETTADESRFAPDAEVTRFFEEVLRRLEELPGVERAASMLHLPRSRAYARTTFTVDEAPPLAEDEAPRAGWQAVSPGYFGTLGIPLLQGRPVRSEDRADTRPVVVVNETLAREHFGDAEVLGRRITVHERSREIVGVCADFVQPRIPPEGRIEPMVFLPMSQHPVRTMRLALRTTGDPMGLAAAVRRVVREVDPDQPITRLQPLRRHIETELSGPKMIAQTLTTFGTAVLLLSAIGMYGLITHDVAQRRREIGIRMAMGAGPARVVRRVTLEGLAIAGLGMLAGAPLAWGMLRAVAFTLEGLSDVEPGVMVVLVAALAAVALLSSYLPARRASRIQPARVLQLE